MAQMETRPGLTAVLGPTNTGKTYLAIERMLTYRTGIIGFPLRLLARENYDKVCGLVGARNVALLTGEEKIVPPTARYFLCTVESMPLDRPSEFVAIDEIQLCADGERGYVFSDRLLRARGLRETMFLGAETMRPVLEKLTPDTKFETRIRFSKLSWAGVKKLTRIPRRSAVVAFSANDVYALAEGIRRSRGGAAVVLGALSPRTRNAQVAMYQAGEVDYLVATDAIGMGLNMDIDHVLFSSLRKFDGNRFRHLDVQEIAQIAGRAGRHTRDGTFGTLAEIGPLEPEIIDAIESHNFDPVKKIWWRNAALEFHSLRDLLKSLDALPPSGLMARAREAEDHIALRKLARDEEVRALASGRDRIRLLWEVCQIPDFRKTVADAHIRLLGRIYRHLCAPGESLPVDWVARQHDHLDRMDGDIDTLMTRIAHTRTWTYIAHRADWVADAAHWRDRARDIEDRLSDALHGKLTERFVDRRTAMLVQARKTDSLTLSVADDGAVLADGEPLGELRGLRFRPERSAKGEMRRLAIAAARRGLADEIGRRVTAIQAAADTDFSLSCEGSILWCGHQIAALGPGADMLSPVLRIEANDFLAPHHRCGVEDRLHLWLENHLRAVLKPLFVLRESDLAGAVRGLAFQLGEALGALPRRAVLGQLKALGPEDKKRLRALGVRVGLHYVYVPALQKAGPVALRAILWAAHHGVPVAMPPDPGLVAPQAAPELSKDFYAALGFFAAGPRMIRVDVLDKLAIRLLRLSRGGSFSVPQDMASTLGLGNEETAEVLLALGYRALADGDGYEPIPRKKRPHKKSARKKPRRKARVDPSSPFAVLQQLKVS